MSDDEDPFEAFEPAEDRDGDPFERLDDPSSEGDDEPADDDSTAEDSAATDGTAAAGSETDEPVFEEEFIPADEPVVESAGTGPSRSPDEPADDQPDREALSDAELFEEEDEGEDPFGGMAGREGDPFGEGESVFESVDVEAVDADEVWESLDEEPTTVTVEGSRYVEVSKHRFCENCEFFSKPPDAHCTHDEAELVEYLDMETVRLLNCPVVAEQRQLEQEE